MVAEQPEGPTGTPFGRGRTGNTGDFGLEAAVELDGPRGCFAFLPFEGGIQTVFHEALFHAVEGANGKTDGGGDILDVPSLLGALADIQQQQCPGKQDLAGGVRAFAGNGLQFVAFLFGEGDFVCGGVRRSNFLNSCS